MKAIAPYTRPVYFDGYLGCRALQLEVGESLWDVVEVPPETFAPIDEIVD